MRTLILLVIPAALLAQVDVPWERIRDANKEPGNWLTYSRDYSGQRYSPLDQVNSGNVNRLHIAWMRQVDETDTFETSPIAVDGTLFVTEPPDLVEALDAVTGRSLWSYRHELPNDLRLCCGKVNRGLAILGNTVYYASTDAHLIALDARTGSLRWMNDGRLQERLFEHGSAARREGQDHHRDGGWRVWRAGFIDGYDAKTGKRLWRFNTIPVQGESGNETWQGESWKTGSATTWVTGADDAETNTVYWGTGNPGPDWNGEVRKGDNLYSDSLIALDPDTGAKKWHFQYTPHDMNDWDSTQTPSLVDGMVAGEPRKMVVLANRNGFYYVLDRVTGKFIAGQPYVKQTWASGLDEAGRPMRVPGAEPSVEGKLIWPSLAGGSNWYSSTYNPKTDLYYVNVKEQAAIYIKGEAEYRARSPLQWRWPERLQRRGAVRGRARARSADREITLGV